MTALGLGAYRAATGLAGALVFGAVLRYRANTGKEDPDRLDERFGRAAIARPDGELVWLHAASVGESLVALSLAEGLMERRDRVNVLMTSGTRTSAALIAGRARPGLIHQFPPADAPAFVRRFLDHWRPDLAVFTESELWPNLILETQRRGVPLALANARMNAHSLKSWARWPGTARAILGAFDWIGAADARTTQGIAGLLDERVEQTGNIKLEAGPPDPDPAALAAVRALAGSRPVFTAASTHPGEEVLACEALREILKTHPDALMIVAPRHPDRADDVASVLTAAGLNLARRSAGETPGPDTQVWLADTMGEMALWYQLCPVSVICGSFIDGIGGHNPIEATRSGSAVITGPFAASFADVYAAYDSHKARTVASTPQALAQAVLATWAGEGPSVEAGLRALDALPGGARPVTLDALEALLDGDRP